MTEYSNDGGYDSDGASIKWVAVHFSDGPVRVCGSATSDGAINYIHGVEDSASNQGGIIYALSEVQ